MNEKPQSDQLLGVPLSEFHPHRPQAPFKKRGNIKTAILVGLLIVVIDILIYFFLIKPDDTQLLKALEPFKPPTATVIPSTAVAPSQAVLTSKISELAKQDLAQRLHISTKEIDLVSEEAVTWNDGSLGCPKPDMMYTQALVEGTKVVLSAQKKKYDYHSGANDKPFLCDKPIK